MNALLTILALSSVVAALDLGKGSHGTPGEFDLYVFATR
jgi:hypothetical protein